MTQRLDRRALQWPHRKEPSVWRACWLWAPSCPSASCAFVTAGRASWGGLWTHNAAKAGVSEGGVPIGGLTETKLPRHLYKTKGVGQRTTHATILHPCAIAGGYVCVRVCLCACMSVSQVCCLMATALRVVQTTSTILLMEAVANIRAPIQVCTS